MVVNCLFFAYFLFFLQGCDAWNLPYVSERVFVTTSATVHGEGARDIFSVDKHPLLLASEVSGFVSTDSGLKYMDVVRGEGKIPEAGQTVRVNYVGWLDDFESEKKFDSSYDRRTPLSFQVGTHQVISGWDEALLTDMPVGTKRRVVIPSELGYGKRGAGGVIPPNSDLYFVMELVGIGVR